MSLQLCHLIHGPHTISPVVPVMASWVFLMPEPSALSGHVSLSQSGSRAAPDLDISEACRPVTLGNVPPFGLGSPSGRRMLYHLLYYVSCNPGWSSVAGGHSHVLCTSKLRRKEVKQSVSGRIPRKWPRWDSNPGLSSQPALQWE